MNPFFTVLLLIGGSVALIVFNFMRAKRDR